MTKSATAGSRKTGLNSAAIAEKSQSLSPTRTSLQCEQLPCFAARVDGVVTTDSRQPAQLGDRPLGGRRTRISFHHACCCDDGS